MKYLYILLILSGFQTHAQINPADVQIARDSFGVPHIFARTDAAASYGLAWAHSEDNFTDIQDLLLVGKGKLGKVAGKKGAQGDYVVALLRCRDIVEEKFHTLSPEFMKILEGYVQGINDYAATHPEEVKLKKAFPATVKDYLTTVVLSLAVISGGDRTIARILGGSVEELPGFQTGGSNAFAFHPSRTTTGEAYLAINSHQPLEGPVAWYEAHIQSDEGTNILGGLFPGGLCVFAGVNEHLGWAHTVNNMDKIDVYQLKMNPAEPDQYEFDGRWKNLEVRTVKLSVKGIPVKIKRKVYWSEYGATMKTKKGVFAMRLTANQDIKSLEQWWRMNKAKNFTEFYNAISMQALPMFNIVYADRYDTIFYISGGRMPVRNRTNGYKWNSTVVGNTSATLWKEFHPIGDLPQYINPGSGYLYNTNHSPFLATDEAFNLHPSGFDPTSGYETTHNNRSARFKELVSGKEKISYEEFRDIKYDNQLPDQLRYNYNLDSMFFLPAEKYPDIREVITTFQHWDKKSDTGSKGAAIMALAYQYVMNKMNVWKNHTLTGDQCLELYRYAAEQQVKFFGKRGVTLGELQKHIRGSKELPVWGLPDVLTAMYSQPQKNGTLKVVAGESLIQLVRFSNNQLPVIETVNCYGASARPSSEHYTDQMTLFVEQKTKPMTLDKETVLRNARKIYQPGK